MYEGSAHLFIIIISKWNLPQCTALVTWHNSEKCHIKGNIISDADDGCFEKSYVYISIADEINVN